MFYIDLTKDTVARFDMGKFMEMSDGALGILESYMMLEIPKLPFQGLYNVSGEGGMPDLLSYNIYGNEQYWWILMAYNNLIDPDELVEGMTIKYPSLASLEQLYFQLVSSEVIAT